MIGGKVTQPTDDKYAVHDLVLADRPIFGTAGKVENQRTLTYYIGAHGPFIVQDKPANLTPAAIKVLVEQHVSEMRTLDTIGQGPQL